MKIKYWLGLMVLFLVVACAGPNEVEPSVSSAEGLSDPSVAAQAEGTLYASSDADFSITLPAEWAVAEATTADFAQMRDSVTGANAFLTDDYMQGLLSSGLQLYALNGDSGSLSSSMPVSIKIIRRDAPASLTLSELVADTVNQFDDILDLTSDIEQVDVRLGNDDAVQISFSNRVKTAVSSEVETHITQYYLMRDGDLYIITLEMGQELVGTYLAAAETAVETFQVTPAE
jgi:hypothetical protein